MSTHEAYLACRVQDLRIAIPVSEVEQVADLPITSRPPKVGSWVRGLSIHNEHVYSVLDVAESRADGDANANVVLMRRRGKEPYWGILIDTVEHLVNLRVSDGAQGRSVGEVEGVLFASEEPQDEGRDVDTAHAGERSIVDVRKLVRALTGEGKHS